jgi:hypothetical protein
MARPLTSREDFEAKVALVSELNWARLAAFIDGEGCISITRSKRKGYTNLQYHLEVIVSGTDPRLHEWLQNNFSGAVYLIKNAVTSYRSNKVCQSWRMFNTRAVVILEHCLPYFIMKREQAEIGLAFMRLKVKGSQGKKISIVELQAHEDLRNKLRAINSPHLPSDAVVVSEVDRDKRIN